MRSAHTQQPEVTAASARTRAGVACVIALVSRHASLGHRSPRRTPLLADAAPVARGRRRATSEPRYSLHAMLLDVVVASTPRCSTPLRPSRPATHLRAKPLDATAVGVPRRSSLPLPPRPASCVPPPRRSNASLGGRGRWGIPGFWTPPFEGTGVDPDPAAGLRPRRHRRPPGVQSKPGSGG